MSVFALTILAFLGGQVQTGSFVELDPNAGGEALPPPAEGLDLDGNSSYWKPPFVLEVEGPDDPQPNAIIPIRIRIERHFVDTTPMIISVEVPEGTVLEEGPVQERLVDGEGKSIVRTFALRMGSNLPPGDFIVKVEQKGKGWGAHAKKTYRFGREELRPQGFELPRGAPIDASI